MAAPAVRPLVPLDLRMFAEQRRRLVTTLSAHFASAPVFAVFKGASEIPRNATDTNFLFKQDSYFQYLFGCNIEDCYGALEVPSGHSMLFIPRLPESYSVWMGTLPTPAGVKDKTGVDAVHYVDEMVQAFTDRLSTSSAGGASSTEQRPTVVTLNGINGDSGLPVTRADAFPGIDKVNHDHDAGSIALFDAITEQRAFKTDLEIELFASVNKTSSRAHVAVMQHCKPGLSQHHLESLFLHHCYYGGGCRHASYTCICATGADSAVLHYVNNDRQVFDGDLALLDMGGEYHGYCSDITCVFPINGKYSAEQKWVYEAVLEAHDAVIAAMKPGVAWKDMHVLALMIVAGHLRKHDLLRATDEEIMEHDLMYAFQPHGLGHLLGLDVHDVGGYTKTTPPRPESLSCKKLRTARILAPRLFITVEPGCYFNKVLLEQYMSNPATARFFNEEKLRTPAYWNFGGVRIESNLIVTETGVRNLTNVPRRVEDVEAVMAGREWIVE